MFVIAVGSISTLLSMIFMATIVGVSADLHIAL